MQAITSEMYDQVIAVVGLKPKFLRELRPKLDMVTDWDREFVTISDRSGNKGVLWIELEEEIYVLPYTLSRGIIDKASGRGRPVICDLCYTQQPGTLAARIALSLPGRVEATRSLLCCADLACSDHVRGRTLSSRRSRAQLRESISQEDRVLRLQRKLRGLVEAIGTKPQIYARVDESGLV
jgi:hypothetical protein